MTQTTEDFYPCTFSPEDGANGIALLAGSLLEENFASSPRRRKTATRIRRPVALRDGSSGTATTILFGPDQAFVLNDVVGLPSVIVTDTTGDQLLAVSQLKMRAGGLLPTGFLSRDGMAVIRAILRRELIVDGLITHPLTVLRLIALMSVH